MEILFISCFSIYSHLFDYLIYTDDESQELSPKRLDLLN